MSTLNSLSAGHSPTLQNPINANSQLVLCINSLLTYKPDTLPTPLITPEASNFFDNNHSHELLQRLCDQKSRLIQFYDTEIDRRQSSSHLSTFLNQVDQLLNEYQSRNTTNTTISKSFPTKLHSSLTNSTSDDPTRPVDDESYSTYFHGKNIQTSLEKVLLLIQMVRLLMILTKSMYVTFKKKHHSIKVMRRVHTPTSKK